MFKTINTKKELNEFFINKSNKAKLYNINTVMTEGFVDGDSFKTERIMPLTSFIVDDSSCASKTITSRFFNYISKKYRSFDCKTIDVDKKIREITLIGHDGSFTRLTNFWSSGELTKDLAEWIFDNYADIKD